MYTGLLHNYFSSVPDSYKYWLIKALIDRMYRINSTWGSFDVDYKISSKSYLNPFSVIDNFIKKYFQNAINCALITHQLRTKHRLRIKKSLFISWLNPLQTNKSHTNTQFICLFYLFFVSSVNI